MRTVFRSAEPATPEKRDPLDCPQTRGWLHLAAIVVACGVVLVIVHIVVLFRDRPAELKIVPGGLLCVSPLDADSAADTPHASASSSVPKARSTPEAIAEVSAGLAAFANVSSILAIGVRQ